MALMVVPSALPNVSGLSPPEAENKAIDGSYHREVEELFSFSQACDTDPSCFEQLNYNMLCGVLWVGCWETQSEP